MLCASRQKLSHTAEKACLRIQLDGTEIPNVTSTKLLGVHLDQQLSWSEHINHVQKKLASNLYLLKQIKNFLPVEARKLFFNSYVLPHFDYCSVIWGNCSKTALNKLVKMQKRAARIILDKDYNTRSNELFMELGWISLEDRINFKRSVQVYKCLQDPDSQGLGDLFEYNKNIHRHNTRAAADNNLHIGRTHCKSFSHLGATTWNNIPAPIRNAKNITNFKAQYLKHYFSSNVQPL